MDMIRHMLIFFFMSMLVKKEKEQDSYKMEVAVRKERWKIVIKKVNRKRKQLLRKEWND
jgi:hypothetical protein